MKASEIFSPQERLRFQIHANKPEFKALVAKTKEYIADILTKYERPYVAFSGGKDSVAMLALVIEQKPTVFVRHWDYGRALVPASIAEQIFSNLKVLAPKAIHIIQKRSHGDEEQARHAHIAKSDFFTRLKDAIDEHNMDMCFMGLRKQESRKRRLRIEKSERSWMRIERDEDLVDNCFPLAEWTAFDVWGYIISNDLHIPSVYKELAVQQNGLENTRLGTFFDDEFKHMGLTQTSGIMFWDEKEKFQKENKKL